MIKSLFAKVPFVTKITMIFVMAFLGLLLSSMVVVLFANSADNIQFVKLLQIVQTTCTFVLPAFFLAYFLGGGVTYLKFKPIRSFRIWLFLFLVMPVAIPAVNLFKSLNDLIVLPDFLHSVEVWMQQMESQSQLITDKFLSVSTITGLVFNLFVMAVVPAFGEEIFFRGILQTTLGEKFNRHYAIWITAFIFSAIHLQFYGFLPRFLLGGMLGYFFVLTGSIWAPILAHFVNNALAIVLFFLSFNGYLQFDIDTVGTHHSWWLGIVSVAFVFLLFHRLKRVKAQHL